MGGIQYRGPLRCNWSLIGDTAMIHFDLMFIVLILVISAAILGGMGGWFLARAKLHKEIQQARYDATNEYFLASQDYDRDYEP